MIESDTTVNINILKMTTHHEFSQFETNSNMVYSMVNPDEHDRILTDPAYRMERTKTMQDKVKNYVQTLNEIERDYVSQHGGLPRFPMNKVDYETMIEVEKSIMKMDRLFQRVDKVIFLSSSMQENSWTLKIMNAEKKDSEKELLIVGTIITLSSWAI